MQNLFSKLFLIIGLLIFSSSVYTYWDRNNVSALHFNNYETQIVSKGLDDKLKNSVNTPYAISIEDLNISAPLKQTKINNNKWETTKNGISYLKTSPKPGEIGNSILYGHNWGRILGNLKNAKPGQIVKISYTDGEVKEFEIKYTQIVSPDDSSILKQTDDKRITLYTCTGLFDSKRFVVTAIEV